MFISGFKKTKKASNANLDPTDTKNSSETPSNTFHSSTNANSISWKQSNGNNNKKLNIISCIDEDVYFLLYFIGKYQLRNIYF